MGTTSVMARGPAVDEVFELAEAIGSIAGASMRIHKTRANIFFINNLSFLVFASSESLRKL